MLRGSASELATIRLRVLQETVSTASLWLPHGLPHSQFHSSSSRGCMDHTEGQHKCTLHPLHGLSPSGVTRSAAGPAAAAATGCLRSATHALHAITAADEHLHPTLSSACL
jgi:hypothetical protein